MTNLPTANQQPIVSEKDGAVIANSRDVAEFFGKAHKDVLRSIENLDCSPTFRRRNFALTYNRRKVGATERSLPAYEMTKDGFAFLAMGFTGAKAGQFKEAYITAFNARGRKDVAPALPDFSNPAAAARAWADEVEAKEQVKDAAPGGERGRNHGDGIHQGREVG